MKDFWTVSLRLPWDMKDPLTGLAEAQRRSVNRLIQVALEDYLASQKATEAA